MSSRLASLGHCLLKLARNLARLLTFRRVYRPGHTAMTLERDDLRLVDRLLRDRTCWNDAMAVRQFETEFGRWNGSRAAFSFISGRVALTACIRALGLAAGDEVIIPGYSCIVVQNAFDYEGITVKHCDIELESYGLDYRDFLAKVNGATRAVLVQHLYGMVSRDFEKIIEYARTNGIKVIEDCAHATGALHRGVKVGNYGDVAFYSFEISKVMTTFCGGMAVSNDESLAANLAAVQQAMPYPSSARTECILVNLKYCYFALKHPLKWLLEDFAFVWYKRSLVVSTPQEEVNGQRPQEYERRMPAPLALLGASQLKKLDAVNRRRAANAEVWDRWCAQHGVERPLIVAGSMPVYLRYPVLVTEAMKRDHAWADPLHVEIGVWFESPLHPSPRLVEACPNAAVAVARCINFPTLFR